MRNNKVIIKAFDKSRKSVIGESGLPITIGPQTFQITLQVMVIYAAYSCLLGDPWIHEAGAVTSTLHQKLKFVQDNKLVTICGKRAFIVSSLSSFSYIEPKEVVGTQFQTLSLDKDNSKEKATSISSYKDAIQVVKEDTTNVWGHIAIPTNNKKRTKFGFSPTPPKPIHRDELVFPIQETFCSGGFPHPVQQTVNTIGAGNTDEED